MCEITEDFPEDRSPAPVPKRGRRPAEPEMGFVQWLEQGLHRVYDGIAQEPIPSKLLDLIERDRGKTLKGVG